MQHKVLISEKLAPDAARATKDPEAARGFDHPGPPDRAVFAGWGGHPISRSPDHPIASD